MKNKHPLKKQAQDFLARHHASELLILPNAWDVATAKIFELEGFKAIGTTSAGISASYGYPDGQNISLAETVDVVRRMKQHIAIPISVDIEAGYATTIEGVVATAKAILDAGAVGINLEDSTGLSANPLYEMALQQEKIRAIRQMANTEDIHLLINARTDGLLVPGEDPEQQLRQAITRGNAYKEAGADCIFIPDVGELTLKMTTELVQEIDAPINIIAGTNTAPIAALEEIGVARVSLGPRPMRATLTLLREMAQELQQSGSYELMNTASIGYAEVNQWFSGSS